MIHGSGVGEGYKSANKRLWGLSLLGNPSRDRLLRMTEMPVVTIKSDEKSVPTTHSKPAGREAAESAQLSGERVDKRCGLFSQSSCSALAGLFPGPQSRRQGLVHSQPPNSPGKISPV